MKLQSYLVCWDDFYENCLNIESQFKSAGFDISVINSGTPRDGWNNVGDIRYYRQFYYALKDFNFDNDYMLFMCGDVSHENWSDVINRAIDVLDRYDDIYLYAPHFTNDPWGFNSTNLKVSEIDTELSIATNTNGIMFFMHKDTVEDMLHFFNYFEDLNGWDKMVSGWAIDVVHSSFAMDKSKLIIRDSKNIITHPAGSSYDHGKATAETALIFDAFNKLDPKSSRFVEKVYGRMSHDEKFMNVQSFYGRDLDLVKSRNKINFHIIYINDERKINRDAIEKYIYGYKHEIKSINAKEPGAKEEFLNNNDFKLAWHSFKDGEFGNFASHYMAWKYVVENSLDSLMIFEDDAKLDDSFFERYNLYIEHCPKDYDVFSMFVHKNQYPRFNNSEKVNEYIAKGYQDWSTLCYIISNSGAKKFLRYISDIGMDYPTDWFIFRHGHVGTFNVYTFTPDHAGGIEIDDQYKSQVQ